MGLCTVHYSYITVFILCHLHRRITDNVLELVEESLDINLTGNHLELQFTDGILLPVVYIFETHTHISVLAATTNSVHRIVFSHPERLRRHVSLPLFILVHLCCDCLCKFEVTFVMGLQNFTSQTSTNGSKSLLYNYHLFLSWRTIHTFTLILL